MANCDKYEEYISLHIDEILPNDQLLDLLEHIEDCKKCHCLYRDLKKISNEFKNQEIIYPEDLSENILDYIQKNKETEIVQYIPKKRGAYYGILGIAASIALVFASTTLSGSSSGTAVSLADTQTQSAVTMLAQPETTNEVLEEKSVADIAPSQPTTMTITENSNLDDSVAEDVETEEIQTEVAPTVSNTETLSIIEYDEYAFVFEYVGDYELANSIGDIIFSNEKSTYFKVSNTILNIEKVLSSLEQAGYVQSSLTVDYNVDATSEYGVIILYKE